MILLLPLCASNHPFEKVATRPPRIHISMDQPLPCLAEEASRRLGESTQPESEVFYSIRPIVV
jgi:hypothetical protein